MEDTELVIGFKSGESAHAYPHEILDYHESINEEVNGLKIAITYCPLTGTGIGWDRIIIVGSNDMAFIVAFYPETTDGDDLELKEVQNAGNVIMKDVEGNSWDIFGEAVSGPREG